MSLHRPSNPVASRHQRPARPHCRGGASSLLRLSQPAAPRLPTPSEVAGWISRAASAFQRSAAPVAR